jgi:hypothetical protein
VERRPLARRLAFVIIRAEGKRNLHEFIHTIIKGAPSMTVKAVKLGIVTAASASILISVAWLAYVNSAVKVVSSLVSPDGRRAAVLLVIDPGAMDGFATAVMIEPGDSFLWRQAARLRREREFVLSDSEHVLQTNKDGQLDVRMRWTGNTGLTIQYPAKAQVIKQRPSHGSITITYIPR